MNDAYIFPSCISISTYLIYNMYGSIRIEEINTVNTVQDRYLNYDGKVKMTITQELKT